MPSGFSPARTRNAMPAAVAPSVSKRTTRPPTTPPPTYVLVVAVDRCVRRGRDSTGDLRRDVGVPETVLEDVEVEDDAPVREVGDLVQEIVQGRPVR